MTTFRKLLVGTTAAIGAIGVVITLNSAYRKAQTVEKVKLEAKQNVTLLLQGTFWNRAEICHSILLKVIHNSYDYSFWNLIRWNLSDGTYEMKSQSMVLQYRLVGLSEKSIQVRKLSSNTEVIIRHFPSASFSFPQMQMEEAKGILKSNWHIPIADLLNTSITSTTEFHRIFSTRQSILCSNNLVNLLKAVDSVLDDATRLPTVLRRLALDYAN